MRSTSLLLVPAVTGALLAAASVRRQPLVHRDAPSATTPALTATWHQHPGTTIRSVLPSPLPVGYPPNIVAAWSGGTVDTLRHRLVVLGGGHNGYYGNELYAFDLDDGSIARLTDPSDIGSTDRCLPELPDGTPASRHTYGAVAYLAQVDRLFLYGGAPACPIGYTAEDTWTFDFSTASWQRMHPAGPAPEGTAVAAAYDPVAQLVYLMGNYSLSTYSFSTNTYTMLFDDLPVGYHLAAAIAPTLRKFLLAGNDAIYDGFGNPLLPGIVVIDLDTLEVTTVSGAGVPVLQYNSPGIAWDPELERAVLWHGGSTVTLFDPETSSFSTVSGSGGPSGAAQENGTFGRWGYVPGLDAFALINDIDQNGFSLSLSLSNDLFSDGFESADTAAWDRRSSE